MDGLVGFSHEFPEFWKYIKFFGGYEFVIPFVIGIFLFSAISSFTKKRLFLAKVYFILFAICLILGFYLAIYSFGLYESTTTQGAWSEINSSMAKGDFYFFFDYLMVTWVLSIGVAFGLMFYWNRHVNTKISAFLFRSRKVTDIQRTGKTDIRTINDCLPNYKEYDPEKYINLKKGVFCGLDANHKPQYIKKEDYQSSHKQILGTTGAGKGIISTIMLAQSIELGEGVFVLDPKDDEWQPHVLKHACEKANKPFYMINLNDKSHQFNLLADIDEEELEELMIAGFSLSEKGSDADHYRIKDRLYARKVSSEIENMEDGTFSDLSFSDEAQKSLKEAPDFFGKLTELGSLKSLNGKTTNFTFKDVMKNGGCVYVVGSMRKPKVITAQRMIFLRLIQLAEKRDRITSKPNPVAIFLDEFKYHISKPALEGLGAARDKGVHILLAHQSLSDIADCPKDIEPEAIKGAIVENCKIRVVYKFQDPDTAQWIASMTGIIQVDDERKSISTNFGLGEEISRDRVMVQSERNYVDTNMLLGLKKGTGFIFQPDVEPKATLIAPIKVIKKELDLIKARELNYKELKNQDDVLKSVIDL